ncbi:helix-turn-helix domain-containing protein [Streptomyces sp. NPDC055808]|uniref:helix-turn-helix domain-containing protein n=1 Tax=Streptomyces sp. NPDC001828 TaxID=3364615 RepID=UPI00369308A4
MPADSAVLSHRTRVPDAVRTAPCPELRGAVVSYRAFTAAPGRSTRRLALPTGLVSLVIGFALPRPVHEGAAPSPPVSSLVSGVRTRAAFTGLAGPATGIEVTLTPTAAYSLFDASLPELTDHQVELPNRPLPETGRIALRLGQLTCWEERFALLDRFLSERIAAGPPAAPGVVRAVLAVRRDGGRHSVTELAAETRHSPRHLERLFKEQVGVPPKAYAQIARFRNALWLLGTGLPPADVAARAGFHDQAHLHREFKSMTGRTPRQFLERARLGGLR